MNRFLATTSRFALCVFTLAAPAGVQAADFSIPPDDGTTSKTITGGETGTVAEGASLITSGVSITWNGNTAGLVTIVNDGTIQSTNNRALNTSGSGGAGRSLQLTNTGLIEAVDDALRVNFAADSVVVDNAGTIRSTGGSQAIDFDNTTNVVITNLAGGLIEAHDADAVRPGTGGLVVNHGIIRAIGSGNSDAVDFQEWDVGGRVENMDGGLIEGARHGITGDGTVEVLNEAGGVIRGLNGSGVNLDGTGSVVNYGLISGNYDPLKVDGDGDGVDIDGIGFIENYGVIEALGAGGVGSDGLPNTADGIALGGGTIINHADAIIRSVGRGILVDDSSTGPAPGATEIFNEGTIESVEDAITLIGGHDDVIVNSGTILSLEGIAIDMGGGDDLLEMNGGLIAGDVFLGRGDDVLLMSDGTLAGSLYGDEGDDQLNVEGGLITGDLRGGAGDDVVIIGDLVTHDGDAIIEGDIHGDGGNDFFLLLGAESILGGLFGGAGDDFVEMLGAANLGAFDAVLGGMTALDGGEGMDRLDIAGLRGGLPAVVTGWEIISLRGSDLDAHLNTSEMTFTGNLLLQIDSTSTLRAAGRSPGVLNLPGDVINDGFLTMIDGEANDRINIGGSYSGSGALGLDVALDGSLAADRVVIAGDSLGSATSLEINDIGNGVGAWTGHGAGNGIALIEVGGTSGAADFTLLGGPIQVGVFQYGLGLESDNVWYLQSDLLDQGYGYGALAAGMLQVQKDLMGGLYERLGDRKQLAGGAQLNEGGSSLAGLGGYSGLWLRGIGSWSTTDADLTVGSSEFGNSFDQTTALGQLGADIQVFEDAAGAAVVGLFGVYGQTWLTADDHAGKTAARWASDVYGFGLTGTWYGSNGLYADTGAQFLWYNGEVSGKGLTNSNGHKADVNGFGFGLGAEVGYAWQATRYLEIVPNARLNYADVTFDDFTDKDGVKVAIKDGQSLEGRIGLLVEGSMRPGRGTWFSTYVEGNIVHEFLGDASVEAAGTELGYDLKGTAAEVGLGLSARLVPQASVYAEVDYRIPFDTNNGTRTLQATGGLRVSF